MKKGFTIIELLVVLGVTAIILMASLPVYNNLQISAQLNETSAQISQTIRLAKTQAQSGFNNSDYGVKFFEDKYIVFQGVSYDLREVFYDREMKLDSPLSLETNLTDDEIVFTKRLGAPNQSGIITLTHDVEGERSITINNLGMVDEE